MPKDKPFLFLKNDITAREKFNKQRAFRPKKEEEEEEQPKIPRPFHQQRLQAATRLFNYERGKRQKNRTIDVPATIDVIRIHFLKRIDTNLQRKFTNDYGLDLLVYEDFNKTGLFSIHDENGFKVFSEHLKAFYTSAEDETYEGKPWAIIVLIQKFVFLSTARKRISFNPSCATLKLFPFIDGQSSQLFERLLQHLQQQRKTYRINPYLTSLEVDTLSSRELKTILDNFDNVKAVTSSRVNRVRPGTFGGVVREFGFTVLPDANNVTVAIIDTGVELIAPLQPVNSGIAIDITGTNAPYFDENGHGTMVAGLVALGNDFLERIQDQYASHANIAVFKVLQNGNEDLQINRIINGIRQLHAQGIRLFNMSLNEFMHMPYNSNFSDFAFHLDKLAYELDILIFISAGNLREEHVQSLYDEAHTSHVYPKHFYCPDDPSEIHQCELTNICPPADSLNNLTIGAIAENYQNSYVAGVTPAKEYPAFYTRKFHYDYEQKVNGTPFARMQRNKHLNKPDIVFSGGDFLDPEAGLEVLSSPMNPTDRYFAKSAGTSLATPLVTSMAAQIAKVYPTLGCQTIKAILLNSAKMPCGKNPPMFRPFKDLLHRLAGAGTPIADNILFTDENGITYVIEDSLDLEEIKAMRIKLPTYMSDSANKLCFTATLCYKFDPLLDNHLNYCPLQIVYGFFRDVSVEQLADGRAEDYKINKGPSWSDDFWPVENRLYSNVQYRYFFLDAEKIKSVDSVITLGIKCTGKKEIDPQHRSALEKTKHPFSLVINISEYPENRASGELYNNLKIINTADAIPMIDLDISLDAEQ